MSRVGRCIDNCPIEGYRKTKRPKSDWISDSGLSCLIFIISTVYLTGAVQIYRVYKNLPSEKN